MRSAAAGRSSSKRRERFRTARRRQQVNPLPQTIDGGKYSEGMPVCRTKMNARQCRAVRNPWASALPTPSPLGAAAAR